MPDNPAHVAQGPKEFVRGALAACINVMLTYPLNKLISRQAYEGLNIRTAWGTILDDVKKGHLFRGIWPPLFQRSLASGAMFASYDLWFHQLQRLKHGNWDYLDSRSATDIREESWEVRVGAAFLAGSSEWLLTPLERTQTLLQHRKYTEVFSSARQAWLAMSKVGIREFYRGGSAILLRNGPANAAFFSLRDMTHDSLPPAPPGFSTAAWDALRDFFSGAILGAAISTFLYPLNTAKMVMQIELSTRHKSVYETLLMVHQTRGGIMGMYRGVWLNSMRSLLSWGITNASLSSFAFPLSRARVRASELSLDKLLTPLTRFFPVHAFLNFSPVMNGQKILFLRNILFV